LVLDAAGSYTLRAMSLNTSLPTAAASVFIVPRAAGNRPAYAQIPGESLAGRTPKGIPPNWLAQILQWNPSAPILRASIASAAFELWGLSVPFGRQS
jgi:hypothetical protein